MVLVEEDEVLICSFSNWRTSVVVLGLGYLLCPIFPSGNFLLVVPVKIESGGFGGGGPDGRGEKGT